MSELPRDDDKQNQLTVYSEEGFSTVIFFLITTETQLYFVIILAVGFLSFLSFFLFGHSCALLGGR